jgi:hypothetical protein
MGSEDFSNAATSPRTVGGLTTGGSLSNGAIVCMISFSSAAPGITSVTWGTGSPQAMTLIKSQTATNQSVHIYGLVGVTSFGTQNIIITWTGGTLNIIDIAASFTGVDQTGGATSFPNANSATAASASPAVTITSLVGNAVMAVFADLSAGFTGTNNTTLYTEGSLSSINGAALRAAGAASVSCTATLAGSDTWTAAGTDIAAVGSGITLPPPIFTDSEIYQVRRTALIY